MNRTVVFRRLQTVSDWSEETFKHVLPGASGTGSPVGPGRNNASPMEEIEPPVNPPARGACGNLKTRALRGYIPSSPRSLVCSSISTGTMAYCGASRFSLHAFSGLGAYTVHQTGQEEYEDRNERDCEQAGNFGQEEGPVFPDELHWRDASYSADQEHR